MPAKQPPAEKLCWFWAETTEPAEVSCENIRTAYRLNLPPCKMGACRRNCKGNPYCINAIGEKVWFNKIDDEKFHDVENPDEDRREPGMFAGLKNLGATCYVNTFLQLWFHNDAVQQGIYQWREPFDETSDRPDPSDDKRDRFTWKPTSVCAHLQVIFALLQLTNKRYVDPSGLIQYLGLDAGEQQDAQEFSKLFLSILEGSITQSSVRRPVNVIKEQFCGSYAYVTRCSNCGSKSERLSDFYELDLTIQGYKTLEDALKGFLATEKLDGDNQYMCLTCNSKQNATREIELKSLPPVLNLQLLRFVFEKKTGAKKKLNSIIQFPDVLDISPFLPAGEQAVYDLTSVLIHRGPSAYSGHYIAHIKGKDSQAWYKFNDEDVEKIKGRNLQLGSEDDIVDSKQKKTPRTPKGYHSSRNAYMLVYNKRHAPVVETAETILKVASTTTAASNSASPVVTTICTAGGDTDKTTGVYSAVSDENTYLSDEQPIDLSIRTKQLPSIVKLDQYSYENSKSSTAQVNSRALSVFSDTKLGDYGNTLDTSSTGMQILKLNLPSPKNLEENPARSELENDSCNTSNNNCSKFVAVAHNANNVTKKSPADAAKDLPHHVLRYVEENNKAFENWVSEIEKMKEVNVRSGREKQETIKGVYRDLVYDGGGQFEWIPLKWLSKWLDDPAVAPAIDNSEFLCAHGKIRPDKSAKMKCVAAAGAETLFDMYGGEIRCKGSESLCEVCVKNKCYVIRTKQRICEDDRIFTYVMKADFTGEPCYWVSKASFRCWRRLALEKLEEDFESEQSTTDRTNDVSAGTSNEDQMNEGDANESFSSSEQGKAVQSDKNNEDDTLSFNEDILCDDHGNLDPDQSYRRLVPELIWTKLRTYFPECPEYRKEAAACEQCHRSLYAEQENKDRCRQAATEQRSALLDLFYDRKRPTSVCDEHGIYAVSTGFVDYWRQFVKDPLKSESITSLLNESLLCLHNKYVFPPEDINLLKSDENVTYVWACEWERLKSFYSTDNEIILLYVVEDGQRSMITIPEVCEECVADRLRVEREEVYDYKDATLYVRRAAKSTKENQDANDSGKDDPDFDNSATAGRKRHNSSSAATVEPPEKAAKTRDAARVMRKSQRRRRVRGEKEVTVSSTHTLKDLKLQIMKLFSVPPFDQNLTINGTPLTNNSATLKELQVPPGAIICLVPDESIGEPEFLGGEHQPIGLPESGFKGTNLLSA